MRLFIRGSEVRLYPESKTDADCMNKIARDQNVRPRVSGSEKYLLYLMPSQNNLLIQALVGIVGKKRGEFLFWGICERTRVN